MNKILLLLFILFQWNYGFSCSCIGKRTVREEFEKSDAVFEGRILSKNKFIVQDNNLPANYKMYKVEFKILVLKKYKGSLVKDTISVITGNGGGDCGIDFILDKSYIIYTNYSNKYFENGKEIQPFLTTDICRRNTINNKKEQRKLKCLIK
ncbi:MAG: hypothetical protein KA275_02135 [Chitinophagaceae bacterium]|nr:hypothetical protein [Chitinophagaceae bacterium]